MERPSFDGVEFYSADDLSLGENLLKAALVIDSLSNDSTVDNSINEVIQLYNVQQAFGCGRKLELWNDDQYLQYQTKAKRLSEIIGRFIGTITDCNLTEIYGAVAIGYLEDFWELFDRYKVYNSVSPGAFSQLLARHDSALQYILKHRTIVNKYDEEIADIMRSSRHSAGMIARAFLEKTENGNQLIFPEHLQKDEYETIIQGYIDTADCNPGILHLIAIAKNTGECPISDRLKLSARKRMDERFKVLMSGSTPLGIGISVSFDRIDTVKKMIHNGDTYEITYDLDWLTENKDYPTILNNFIYVFEHFDFQMRSRLVSVESSISAIERAVGTKGKNEFLHGYAFNVCQSLFHLQVVAYDNLLQKHNIFLEDVFKWFFEEYLPQEFHAYGFHFNPPSKGTSYIEKCRTIAAEMEGVLKQFRMYARDGEINQELYEMSSEHIFFKDIPSMIPMKYAYASGNLLTAAMYHLFSDQSHLAYLHSSHESFSSCYELLTQRECRLSEFSEVQQQTYKWLIDKGFIRMGDDLILHLDVSKASILQDLYKHDVLCPNHFIKLRTMVDEWIKSGDLIVENTLFSRPEQNYLNYMLNKSIYSNGQDLRNKYSHSTYPSDEQQQRSDYYSIMTLMILITGKINDEFCLKEKCGNSVNE